MIMKNSVLGMLESIFWAKIGIFDDFIMDFKKTALKCDELQSNLELDVVSSRFYNFFFLPSLRFKSLWQWNLSQLHISAQEKSNQKFLIQRDITYV